MTLHVAWICIVRVQGNICSKPIESPDDMKCAAASVGLGHFLPQFMYTFLQST